MVLIIVGLSRKVKGSEAGVPQDLLRREESKAFKPGEVSTQMYIYVHAYSIELMY